MSVAAVAVLMGAGCKAVEPAPADVDGLAHYFWDGFDDESEETLLPNGIVNLHDALDADTIEEAFDGTITDLNGEQLALVGKDDLDPADPAGVFMANVINCGLDDVEASAYALDQMAIHPGIYEDYSRVYTTDFDAYIDRQARFLGWETDYFVDGFGATYSAIIDGTMRYIPEVDAELSPHGPAVITRGVLREAAYIEGSDKQRGLMQDYQLEIFYERAPGETVHFYVMWRDMVYAADTTFDSETMQRLVLNSLVDWDEEIEDYCGQ
ncbi:MAG: hypothetical protein AAFV53_17765 [Myxococcota bacterium]